MKWMKFIFCGQTDLDLYSKSPIEPLTWTTQRQLWLPRARLYEVVLYKTAAIVTNNILNIFHTTKLFPHRKYL